MRPMLTSHGFTQVGSGTGSGGFASPQKGDIVVWDGIPPAHENGHTAMWDGTQWVSDTKQPSFLAANAYANGRFRVYRSAGQQAHAKPL